MSYETCAVCQYTYYPSLEGDVASHKKFHNLFVHGVSVNRLESDEEVFDRDGFRVILVSPRSPLAQRKRAERIARRANRNSGNDFAAYHAEDKLDNDGPLVFIGITKARAVAMLVLKKAQYAARFTWSEYETTRGAGTQLRPAQMWTIAMIWTLENERRKGFAGRLITLASEQVGVPVSGIAWSTPLSKFGEPLARSIVEREIFLTL